MSLLFGNGPAGYRPLTPQHTPHGSEGSIRSRTPGQLSLHEYRKQQYNASAVLEEGHHKVKRKAAALDLSTSGHRQNIPGAPPTPRYDDSDGEYDGEDEYTSYPLDDSSGRSEYGIWGSVGRARGNRRQEYQALGHEEADGRTNWWEGVVPGTFPSASELHPQQRPTHQLPHQQQQQQQPHVLNTHHNHLPRLSPSAPLLFSHQDLSPLGISKDSGQTRSSIQLGSSFGLAALGHYPPSPMQPIPEPSPPASPISLRLPLELTNPVGPTAAFGARSPTLRERFRMSEAARAASVDGQAGEARSRGLYKHRKRLERPTEPIDPLHSHESTSSIPIDRTASSASPFSLRVSRFPIPPSSPRPLLIRPSSAQPHPKGSPAPPFCSPNSSPSRLTFNSPFCNAGILQNSQLESPSYRGSPSPPALQHQAVILGSKISPFSLSKARSESHHLETSKFLCPSPEVARAEPQRGKTGDQLADEVAELIASASCPPSHAPSPSNTPLQHAHRASSRYSTSSLNVAQAPNTPPVQSFAFDIPFSTDARPSAAHFLSIPHHTSAAGINEHVRESVYSENWDSRSIASANNITPYGREMGLTDYDQHVPTPDHDSYMPINSFYDDYIPSTDPRSSHVAPLFSHSSGRPPVGPPPARPSFLSPNPHGQRDEISFGAITDYGRTSQLLASPEQIRAQPSSQTMPTASSVYSTHGAPIPPVAAFKEGITSEGWTTESESNNNHSNTTPPSPSRPPPTVQENLARRDVTISDIPSVPSPRSTVPESVAAVAPADTLSPPPPALSSSPHHMFESSPHAPNDSSSLLGLPGSRTSHMTRISDLMSHHRHSRRANSVELQPLARNRGLGRPAPVWMRPGSSNASAANLVSARSATERRVFNAEMGASSGIGRGPRARLNLRRKQMFWLLGGLVLIIVAVLIGLTTWALTRHGR